MKLKTYRLSKLYEAAGLEDKSRKVAYCSTYLTFGETQSGRRYLKHANFCKDRLCPMCGSRKARRMAADLSRVLDKVQQDHPGTRYIFLTLTVRNVTGQELPQALKDLTAAWNKLAQHRDYKRAIKGGFRSIEITRNRQDGSYHPHIHAVLAVEPEYFLPRSGLYLSHSWWVEHWKTACKADYSPAVRIQRTRKKGDQASAADADQRDQADARELDAAKEAAKYPLKNEDYIATDLDLREAVQVVLDYTKAIKGRRFTSFMGWLKDAAQALKVEEEPQDLTDIHDGNLREDITLMICEYRWTFGAKDFVLESRSRSAELLKLLEKTAAMEAAEAMEAKPDLSEINIDQLEIPGMPQRESKHPT